MSGNDNPYSTSYGTMSATATYGGGAPQAASAPAAAGSYIKDTTTANFTKDVIEDSRNQPVLVDFWAPWCGPCKQLTPIIEKAVKDARGKVKLVKMNIDEHPAIPGQMGIQSIPAVIAFVNGQPADGFLGALPENQVLAFIERITKENEGALVTVGIEEVTLSFCDSLNQLFGRDESLSITYHPNPSFLSMNYKLWQILL